MKYEQFEFFLVDILLKNKIQPATPIEEGEFLKGGLCEGEPILARISEDDGWYFLPEHRMPSKLKSPEELIELLNNLLKKYNKDE